MKNNPVNTQSKKLTKKQVVTLKKQATIDFIKGQINVDITQWRDMQWEDGKRAAVLVDWKRMPATAKNQIQQLASQYGGTLKLETASAWGMEITLIKKD